MAKDILSEYGSDKSSGGRRATCGGVEEAKPLPYSPPVGPKNQTRGPGIGGTNHGCCGTQGKR